VLRAESIGRKFADCEGVNLNSMDLPAFNAEERAQPSRGSDTALALALNQCSRLLAYAIALAGLLVLLGWARDVNGLKRVLPGLVAMNPLTAVCFEAAAGSLAILWWTQLRLGIWKQVAGGGLAICLVLVGLLKLLDYTLGWHVGLDQVLFSKRIAADHSGLPNQMAPNTALNFLLSGCVLLFFHIPRYRRSRLAQDLAVVIFLHSLLALLGYLYSANYLYGVGSYIPMALHTAGLFALLSAGMLFAQTDVGAVALFVSNTTGGMIARRLLPVAFAIPALLGALRFWGEKHGLVNSEMGVTMMVLACIAIFTVLIWWNAVLLNRADCRRLEAEAKLRAAHDELELRVQERTAELLESNRTLRAEISERQKAEARAREQAEEKRKLEVQFLRSQRMESIGALAGGIAHDLNNALVPIMMGSQLLLESAAIPADQQRVLDLIATSGQRCSEMVHQILSFARGTRAETGAVAVRHLIKEMAKIARDTFPKSIRIQCQIPNDLWNVPGDATELHQVLMNLCVNARDAMPQGGELVLDARNVVISAHESALHGHAGPGDYVVLTVGDTGTGIPQEVLPRIFEPFFTTKAPEKGTGLGLSTVATIVKRHSGAVEVQTQPGKGTQFRVYLPAAAAEQPKEAEAKPALPAGGGEVILVVDDEQLVLELARTTLENYGYEVLTASNGIEAIAAFESRKAEIQLLIMDTDMPFLDGLSAIRSIQKIAPELPIILASATKQDTSALAGVKLPGLTRLAKPYGVDQLLTSVAAVLGRSSKPN
jgi:signal transduction histidine kinase/ActR/RegA family two-component response regulator